jgi:hypothetical protein
MTKPNHTTFDTAQDTAQVRALPITGTRYDRACLNNGLHVRVHPGGSMQYFTRTTNLGKKKFTSLGDAWVVSYSKALKRVQRVAKGKSAFNKTDPEVETGTLTGKQLAMDFYHQRIIPKRAVPLNALAMLEKYIIPGTEIIPADA